MGPGQDHGRRSRAAARAGLQRLSRQVTVAPERIAAWLDGCESRHGELVWSHPRPGTLLLSAADGFGALLEPLLARDKVQGPLDPAHPPQCRADLDAWVGAEACLALVLVRRGGYAVGIAEGPSLTAHKVGTRYVQSRTAAGGWSQQRFARRRGNQADALVGAVQDHVTRVVLAHPEVHLEALIVGGDRALVADVLGDPRLAALRSLPRSSLYDLPDPRLDVLRQALVRGRGIPVLISDPPTPPTPS